MERAAQNIIEIGDRLADVKAALPRQFGQWLKAEFGWGETTAWKMMRVAAQFKGSQCEDLDIAPSALYLLASPSTDVDVREEIIDQAKSGEKITHAAVKATIIDIWRAGTYRPEADATAISRRYTRSEDKCCEDD